LQQPPLGERPLFGIAGLSQFGVPVIFTGKSRQPLTLWVNTAGAKRYNKATDREEENR